VKLGFQGNNLTLKLINETAVSLGLPTNQSFINRRIARAFDLVESNKVSILDDGIFRVRSQYEPELSYIVNLNHGEPSCDCPDGERTINCKHRIAALLFSQKQVAITSAITIIKTTDGDDGDYWRRCWLIAQGNSRPMVYEERDRRLFCNCGAHYEDCEHKLLVIRTVKKELAEGVGYAVEGVVSTHRTEHANEKRIVNECGTDQAKAIQDQLNGQDDSQENSGNGAKAPSQPTPLDITDPFQESEQYDIDQIEGRKNGELAWKLRNGEYCISYKGIMTLAEKHGIEYEVSLHDDTHTVIAKAMNGSERISGKPILGNVETALELAKRNAARQLLPLPEILAVEHKAKLEAEFDWQKAKAKCVELVGEANVSIIIHDLTQAGKLRQDNPSHYTRVEWLQIFKACQADAQIPRDPKSLNRWSYNSAEFLLKCHEVINQVRESKKSIEANEMPLQTEVKRKLQMDKKLRTWLVESDGSKKEISCREICEKFESEKNPRIVTRLRAGIDSGADISTVEID
jgi:hypothetical protein